MIIYFDPLDRISTTTVKIHNNSCILNADRSKAAIPEFNPIRV